MIRNFDHLIGKKIFLVIKWYADKKRFYNCTVNEVNDEYMTVTDKFGKKIVIKFSEILSAEEKD